MDEEGGLYKVYALKDPKTKKDKISSNGEHGTPLSHYDVSLSSSFPSSSLPSAFTPFSLCSPLQSACKSFGLVHPTPIQSICIPHIMKGHNVVGKSKTGSGKCWAEGTKLLMFDGEAKRVEDIVEGDILIGPESLPRRVREGSLVKSADGTLGMLGNLFEVRWNGGCRQPFRCNGEHILVVTIGKVPWVEKQMEERRNEWRIRMWAMLDGSPRVVSLPMSFSSHSKASFERERMVECGWEPLVFETTVKEYLNFSDNAKKVCRMFQSDALQFSPPAESLADRIDTIWGSERRKAKQGKWSLEKKAQETAWVIGMWMVGERRENVLIVSDVVVVSRISEWRMRMNDGDILTQPTCDKRKFVVDFNDDTEFHQLLASYNMGTSNGIPMDLLRETMELKRYLLAGIIDGSGHRNEMEYQMTIQCRFLMDSVVHLCRGLGFRVSELLERIKMDNIDGFSISITGKNLTSLSPCFCLPSNVCDASEESSRDVCWNNDSFSIEMVEDGRYFGFTLDGVDGRCLMNDFIVTHNTAAFLLPILHEWNKDPFGVFAVILTPTRELAFQLSEQVDAFGTKMRVSSSLIVGGGDITQQSVELSRSPDIVIATPGRLADLLRTSTVPNLKYLKFLVMDEADRLLEESFQHDVDTILNLLPPKENRQTLMFSATISPSAPELYALRIPSPTFVEVSSLDAVETVKELDQRYLFIPQITKEGYLWWILTQSTMVGKSTIVFTGTCKGCEILEEILLQMEVDCVSLHSRKSQLKRLDALNTFRSSKSHVLVCTDVASRGLDIPQVILVVNYDVPRMTEDYIHRVGRTARAGRGGMAISFVSQYDIENFKAVEEEIGQKMEEFKAKEDEVMDAMKAISRAKMAAKRIVEEREESDPKREKLKRDKEIRIKKMMEERERTTDSTKRRESPPPYSKRQKKSSDGHVEAKSKGRK